jgi:hypothetical protein
MGENQQDEFGNTQDFDTDEFLRHQTETADRKKPIESLHRLYLRADHLEKKEQLWGALLALQEALAILPYTPMSVAEQEDLGAKFVVRIQGLTSSLNKIDDPWPGEAADPAKIEGQPAKPKTLHGLAARLGLTALGS